MAEVQWLRLPWLSQARALAPGEQLLEPEGELGKGAALDLMTWPTLQLLRNLGSTKQKF